MFCAKSAEVIERIGDDDFSLAKERAESTGRAGREATWPEERTGLPREREARAAGRPSPTATVGAAD